MVLLEIPDQMSAKTEWKSELYTLFGEPVYEERKKNHTKKPVVRAEK